MLRETVHGYKGDSCHFEDDIALMLSKYRHMQEKATKMITFV